MPVSLKVTLFGILFFTAAFAEHSMAPPARAARAGDAGLPFPLHYREWVYLSSGFDMGYRPEMPMDHHTFDNVFVNPHAYKAFMATGAWPDHTILALEVRSAQSKGSINQRGSFQGAAVMALEVHVKDEARFPGNWAFYTFGEQGKTGKLIPASADCYTCHVDHGAVDTTFVQFYPTLLPVAQRHGTLSPLYLKEAASPRN